MLKRNNEANKKSNLVFLSILLLVWSIPINASAHTAISSSPTTSCSSIDSTDLGTHSTNQIDSRIAAATPFSTSGNIFSTVGTTSGGPLGATTTPWVRNSGVWTSNLDLTGVAVWQQSYNGYSSVYQHTPTLITPRHFVIAHHWGIGNGSTVAFVARDNTVVYRTVVNTVYVANDIQVGVLDSDVPDSITYYPIIASTTLDTLVNKYSPAQDFSIPIIGLNQLGQVYTENFTSFFKNIFFQRYTSGARASYSLIGDYGDSGHPNFMVIDNQPIFLTTYAAQSEGPTYGAYISEINNAINNLGNSNGYSVTVYNPTCFTRYIPNHLPVFTGNTSTSTTTVLPINTPIYTAHAIDSDVGQTISYSLSSLVSNSSSTLSLSPSTYFSIDSNTGIIKQIANINNVVVGDSLTLKITAQDNGSPAASTFLNLYIKVKTPVIPVPEPPIVVSAIIKDFVLNIGFNKGLSTTSIPDPSDFLVKVNNNTKLVQSINIVDQSVQLSLPNLIPSGDLVTVAYTPGLNKIKDIYGAFANSISSTTPITVSNSHFGNIDEGFNPGTGFRYVFDQSIGAGTISRIRMNANKTKIFVSGLFDSYNNIPARGIIKLNLDGSIDNSFTSPGSWLNTYGIFDFVILSDDKILVFGDFPNFNGAPGTSRVARLNSDGSIDATFNSGLGFNGEVWRVLRQTDGNILVAGDFTQYDGTTENKIVRIDSEGVLDDTFSVGTGPNSINNIYTSLYQQPDGKILYTSTFDAFNGTNQNSLVRLNLDGSVDSSFDSNSLLSYLRNSGWIQSYLASAIELDDGKILVLAGDAGPFLVSHNGTFIRPSFNTGSVGESTLLKLSSGKVAFSSRVFEGTDSVLRKPVGVVSQSGTNDQTFSTSLAGATDYSNGLSGKLFSSGNLVEGTDGGIYYAGELTTYNGISRNGIVKIAGTTTQDSISPTVTNVTSTSTGLLSIHQTIPIQVIFSEAVIVAGTPVLSLKVGTAMRQAVYVSGSGSTTLMFSYTVNEGDNEPDLDYSSINALVDSNGTIIDAAGNTANLTLPLPGGANSLSNNTNISIDTSSLTITSGNVSGNVISLEYSKLLSSSTTPSILNFAVTKNGTLLSSAISSISISSSTVTLTLTTSFLSSDTVSITYTDGAGALSDILGNYATTTLGFALNNTTPVVQSSGQNNSFSGSGSGSGSGGGGAPSVPIVVATSTSTLNTASSSVLKIVTISTSASSTPIFTTTLQVTSVDTQVKYLQSFLNTQGFSVSKTGAGSPGKETNKFGPATKAALIKFQKAHGIKPAIGFFGPLTRKVVNEIVGK